MIEMLGYDIEDERVPAVYELSYKRRNLPCLELRLHEEFVAAHNDTVPVEGFLKPLQKEHNIGDFSPFKEGDFGFGGALKKKGYSKGFIIYEMEIPAVRKTTNEPCERCEGTGWDKSLERECSFCRGGGHHIDYDWIPINAISASLQILSMMAETFDKRTSASIYQLLTFQLVCGKGQGHYPIGGHYGIDFCNWLNSLPKRYFNNVIEEMQNVYSHIFGKDVYMSGDFQAYVESGTWLIISCPGDACGIHPCDSYSWKPGQGREYSCHNMDTSAQQMMLLTALGILSDMAREHMEG